MFGRHLESAVSSADVVSPTEVDCSWEILWLSDINDMHEVAGYVFWLKFCDCDDVHVNNT